MLHLEGAKAFALPRPTLWAQWTDFRFLVECIPDLAEAREIKDRSASVVVRPGFSFVRGEIQLTIEKLEESPPHSARMRITSKGVGSSSEVEVAFNLDEKDNGSVVHWAAEIKQLGGLLKTIPQGLIRAAAQKIINDLMATLDAKLQN